VRAAPLLLLALAVAGCGGRAPGGGDAGADGPPGDAAPPSPCPAAPPAAAGACSREGLVCAYGVDPRPQCRPTATCRGAAWELADPGCPLPPPAACPETRAAAADQPCPTQDARCSYDGLACHCTSCVEYPVVHCGGEAAWRCDAPNPDPACPAALPNLGTGCAPESKMCVYGCEPNLARRCVGGVWLADTAPGGCPI
jgi:hypothetical protein